MARVSIWNLSREDEDVLDNVNATEVTVIDDLEQATNDQDVVASASQIETDIVTLEESEEVVAELEDQVVENEHMIENSPENITEEIVAVAQEKYFIAAARLGYPTQELMKNRISIESARVSPVQALTISTEGVKETLKRMLEAMKNMFSKIVESIKKLLAKAAMFFGGVVSKAEELKKRLNKLPGDIKVGKIAQDDIFFKMPIFILSSNNSLNVDHIMKFINTNYLKEFIIAASSSTPGEGGEGGLVGRTLAWVGSIGPRKGKSGEFKFIWDWAVKNTELNEGDPVIIVEAYKNYISCIAKDETEDGIKYEKFDLQQDKLIAPGSIGGLDKNNLNKVLDAVITNDKTKKQYFDVIYQSQNNITTMLNKYNNIQDDKSAEAQKELRLIRVFGSKLAFSSIMQYINTNKTLVDIVAKAIDGTKDKAREDQKAAVQQQQAN